jgi:hypothetical protein
MTSRLVVGLAALSLLVPLGSAAARPAEAPEADKSDNVKFITHFEYPNEEGDFFAGGTDIDFSGKYVYAMQQAKNGGIYIVKNSKKPKLVNFFACPGEQNDVAVVKPGLIALGYHSTMCGDQGGGVRLVDVKNPKKPKLLGAVNDLPGGTHTLTAYPGEPIIYASPGGLANGGGVQQILDVSNPKKPEVAATFTPTPSGCHDFTFHISKDKKLGICPGAGSTTIFDVSDPLSPSPLGVASPPMFFQHSAAVTDDGNLLVIGDENFGALECAGGPTGAMYAYDISNPSAPILQGYFGTDHGSPVWVTGANDRSTWCTSHNYNFIPGTYTMVQSWYAAGFNVIDWSNPTTPEEIAYYVEPEGKSNYWSAYWHDGRIWANDRVDGLDVFEVKGLKEGKGKN